MLSILSIDEVDFPTSRLAVAIQGIGPIGGAPLDLLRVVHFVEVVFRSSRIVPED